MKLPWNKLCIINLKQNKKRLKNSLKQIKRENLDGNKCVEAVYGYDFVPYGKQIKNTKNKKNRRTLLKKMREKLVKNKTLKRTKYRTLRIGEIGCNLSFLNTFKNALEKNYNKILVLEDDFKLVPNFTQKVLNVMKHVPKDYDVLYLGISDINYNWGDFKKINNYVNKPLGTRGYSPGGKVYAESEGGIYGMHGFIINKKAMKLFIKDTLPMTYPADVTLGKLATQKKLIKAYSLKDHLVTTHNFGSNTM